MTMKEKMISFYELTGQAELKNKRIEELNTLESPPAKWEIISAIISSKLFQKKH